MKNGKSPRVLATLAPADTGGSRFSPQTGGCGSELPMAAQNSTLWTSKTECSIGGGLASLTWMFTPVAMAWLGRGQFTLNLTTRSCFETCACAGRTRRSIAKSSSRPFQQVPKSSQVKESNKPSASPSVCRGVRSIRVTTILGRPPGAQEVSVGGNGYERCAPPVCGYER